MTVIMDGLITEIVQFGRISGHTLKMQRMRTGLSQRALADLIKKVTGSDQIILNGSVVSCSRGTIERMENDFPIEFYTDKTTALIIQKILSNDKTA